MAEEAPPPRPVRRRASILFYRGLGGLMVALAAAGVFLPLLPTTPFLLVAVWAFARSSPELAERLRRDKRFGPILTDWEERGAIPLYAKVLAVSAMGASWTWVALTRHNLYLTAGLGVALAAVAVWIVTRPTA